MIGVHIEDGEVSVRKARRPRRKRGEALIRLRVGGICNTDLELQRGYYGFAGRPGHEFAGEVVSAGDPAWVGRRVVGEINRACGKCDWCKRGLGRHCPHRTVLGIAGHPGAFAGYLTLPVENLHRIPASVPDEEAVFAEPIAAACEILDQVRIPKGVPVAVLGDGKLGLLVGQVLAAHGADVRQFGRHRANLAIAEAAGAKVEIVGRETPAAKFDWVVDATGSKEGLGAAIRMTRPRGVLVLKSTVHGKAAIDAARVVVDEITLVGSRCGRFVPALRLLKQGRLRLREMIDSRFPLPEAPRAFRRASKRGVLKVLLEAA